MMPPKIDDKTVRHMADLAHLAIPEANVPTVASELAKVVGWVDQIAAAEISIGTEEESTADVRREDHPHVPGGPRLLDAAAARDGDEVRVASVLGEAT